MAMYSLVAMMAPSVFGERSCSYGHLLLLQTTALELPVVGACQPWLCCPYLQAVANSVTCCQGRRYAVAVDGFSHHSQSGFGRVLTNLWLSCCAGWCIILDQVLFGFVMM